MLAQAVRYDDPLLRKQEEVYDFFLQNVTPDSESFLIRFADNHPFKCYQDRKEELKASRMLERFREAANSQAWVGYGARGTTLREPVNSGR